MKWNMTKPTNHMGTAQRHRSACTVCCALCGMPGAQSFFMHTAKALIRLWGCAGWSESSWGTHDVVCLNLVSVLARAYKTHMLLSPGHIFFIWILWMDLHLELHLEGIRFYCLMWNYSGHFMPVNFCSYSLLGIIQWHNYSISLIEKL